MIVEYDEDGRIFHVISDPVPEHMVAFLTQEGRTFLNLPPTPWPAEPALDEEGNPVMVQATDEAGQPLFKPVLDPEGNQEFEEVYNREEDIHEQRPLFEPVMVQAMESNGMEYAACAIATDYVVDGAVVLRPVLDLPEELQIDADGVDEARLENLPTPCRITVDGVEYTVEDGEFVMTAELPAEYVVVVDQWPYLPHTMRVVAS